MIKESLAYKTIQKMLDELESGKQFARGLKGRCFHEAFFDDLEKLIVKQPKQRLLETFAVADANNNHIELPATRKYPLAIAASISLLLVSLYFSIRLFLPNEVHTANSEFKTVELPDHSKISLNAASSISYNPVSWYWDRKVKLSGEAFFEVEKGSDFIVQTESGNVKVVGTSFNVIARENNFRVDCKTGIVEVKAGSEKVILHHDETASLQLLTGKLEKETDQNDYVASWRKGFFNFDAEPLSNVIKELERQYNVSINVQTPEDHRFSGYFPINNLDASLETVCSALGLQFSIQENGPTREIIVQ